MPENGSSSSNEQDDKDFNSERLREIVIDLEVAKKRETELRNLSESLVNGVKALTSSNKAEEIFANLVASLNETLGFDQAFIIESDTTEGSDKNKFMTLLSTNPAFSDLEWYAEKTFNRILKGKPVVLADITKVKEWQNKPPELIESAKSTLNIPVLGERHQAIMIFTKNEKGYFTNSHKEMATRLIPLSNQAILNTEQTELIAETLHLVSLQHREIEGIFNNISEALFVINIEAGVNKQCSPFFRTLLGISGDYEGKYHDVLTKLMSDKSSDDMSKYTTTLDMSLGEDRFQWDMNAYVLPKESEYLDGDNNTHYLEWDWCPIESEDDIIEQILVSVRDVTELRKLKEESQKEKDAIDKIYQIVEVGLDKTKDFLATSTNYIDENEKLVSTMSFADPDPIAYLFRNMHTIKGNARTFNFRSVSTIAHDAEAEYDRLRKEDGANFDKALLLQDLQTLRTELDSYQTIVNEKLSSLSSGGNSEKALDVVDTISQLVEAPSDTLIEDIKQCLFKMEAKCLPEITTGHIESLSDLAAQLSKPVPKVVIEHPDFFFADEFATILVDVLTHCFRNSMDHGIENTDTRQELGKPEAGTIKLSIEAKADYYCLHYQDDGRGLNLARLAEKAENKESDEAIAQVIFASGVSTAEQVSDVSGRGVGMDAVRSFLTKMGSSIDIEFVGQRDKDDYRPFRLVIKVPNSKGRFVKQSTGTQEETMH